MVGGAMPQNLAFCVGKTHHLKIRESIVDRIRSPIGLFWGFFQTDNLEPYC